MPDCEGVPIKTFLEHFAQEVIRADAEMQLLQRRGWLDLNQGFPLMEGLDHCDFLGLTEVRLTFRLKEVLPGFWSRFRRWTLLRLDKPVPSRKRLYRFCPERSDKEEGIGIAVTIGRDREKRFVLRSEPSAETLKEIYVAHHTF